MSARRNTVADFWRRVEKTESCWLWTGAKVGGYGVFNYGNRPWRAPRFAYHATVGPVPPELRILHHCDNPPCVRPDHLFPGTDGDNVRDCVAKGRRHGQPRITLADVVTIRHRCANGERQRAIAREFSIPPGFVSRIVNGKSYALLGGPLRPPWPGRVGAKLSVADVIAIRKRCADGEAQRRVASEFGTSQTNVSQIARRKTWRDYV